MIKSMIKIKPSNQSGQVLLMLVLISSVLLTVGLSMTQIGVNETKISKLEEDSKKAFQAAEAGIEKTLDAMKTNPNTTGESIARENLNQVAVQTKVVKSNDADATKFITPVIRKDEQFTFYLSGYDPVTGLWSDTAIDNNLTFYLNSNKKNCSTRNNVPAIELTYIYSSPSFASEKWIIDPCGTFTSPDNRILSTVDSGIETYFAEFQTKTSDLMTISSSKKPRIIVARVLYADTMIGLKGSTALKEQGKFITSTADSSTNVTKKIELFQSLPQIPADFFVTSF